MAYTRLNAKRHIPLVSLLLWHKTVAMRCFIWPPPLQLWSGKLMIIRVWVIFKKFQPPVSVSLFLMLCLMLDGLILFSKCDFRHVRCI